MNYRKSKLSGKSILVLIHIIFVNTAFAAPPKLFFSDLTDGAISGWEGSSSRGAAVSIWGRGFGGSRGSSTVTVCGVALTKDSDYAEWSATSNPTVPLGLQRITFWLNSSMAVGPGTISVTTGAGKSEEIPFYCRNSGKIYFLDSTNGNDGWNGLFSASQGGGNGPKKTTAWARGNLKSGDAVYLREGTYSDHDSGTMYHSGGLLSFGTQGGVANHANGEANNSITVTAYPGELVDMQAGGVDGDASALRSCIYTFFAGTQLRYWTFSKFKMNASWAAISLGGMWGERVGLNNIRIIGIDATTDRTTTSQWGNILVAYGGAHGADHLYFYGNYFHDQMSDYRGQQDEKRAYQVYVGGYGTLNHINFGWNEMGWGLQGRGMQIYGHHHDDSIDNLHIHDNWFHHNNRNCVVLGGGDGTQDYAFVKNAYFYNNIVSHSGYKNEMSWMTLSVAGTLDRGGAGGNFYIYNNLFYNEKETVAVNIDHTVDLLEFRNNIVITKPNNYQYFGYYPGNIDSFVNSTTVRADHNIYFGDGDGKPSWDQSTLSEVDPVLTNSEPENFSDFRIQESSPAVDAGTDAVASIVTKDFWGSSRPLGSGFDIGPYEYLAGWDLIAPAAPAKLGIKK
jgi:hypothetical protein